MAARWPCATCAKPSEAARRAVKASPTSRGELGRRAEQAAQRYLVERGLRPLGSNLHNRYGEIDLLMRDGETLVFVEVRYRRRADFGGALASVDARKRGKLLRAAAAHLQQHGLDQSPCRFDAIGVAPAGNEPFGCIEWVADAFRAD